MTLQDALAEVGLHQSVAAYIQQKMFSVFGDGLHILQDINNDGKINASGIPY